MQHVLWGLREITKAGWFSEVEQAFMLESATSFNLIHLKEAYRKKAEYLFLLLGSTLREELQAVLGFFTAVFHSVSL